MNAPTLSHPPLQGQASDTGRLAERETVIQYDDTSPTASVWTCHRALAAGLRRRGVRPGEVCRNRGREVAWLFQVPKEWVQVRPKRRASTSEAALAARRKALLAAKTSGHKGESQVNPAGEGVGSHPASILSEKPGCVPGF